MASTPHSPMGNSNKTEFSTGIKKKNSGTDDYSHVITKLLNSLEWKQCNNKLHKAPVYMGWEMWTKAAHLAESLSGSAQGVLGHLAMTARATGRATLIRSPPWRTHLACITGQNVFSLSEKSFLTTRWKCPELGVGTSISQHLVLRNYRRQVHWGPRRPWPMVEGSSSHQARETMQRAL